MRFRAILSLAGGIGILGTIPALAETPFRVVSFSGNEVRVDVGSQESRASVLKRAVVLTAAGVRPAILMRSEKTCVALCGEESQVCHFEAVLRVEPSLKETPLAVWAGEPRVTNIAAVISGPPQPLGDEQQWLDSEPVTMSLQEDSPGETYRWTRYPEGVFLTSQTMGKDFYSPPLALSACTTQQAKPFTKMVCPAVQLLYEGKTGIALSFSDYAESTVEPLLHFQLDGHEAVLIRLGLKAEVALGLLIKENKRWILHVRPADYALLC